MHFTQHMIIIWKGGPDTTHTHCRQELSLLQILWHNRKGSRRQESYKPSHFVRLEYLCFFVNIRGQKRIPRQTHPVAHVTDNVCPAQCKYTGHTGQSKICSLCELLGCYMETKRCNYADLRIHVCDNRKVHSVVIKHASPC